jgi:uncharacterized membrane protein YbaN (DUF454 family)
MIPSRARKIADWVIGLTLIAAGIVAGFLPVIQGWVFVLAGLAVLSSHSRIARTVLDRLKRAGRGVRDRIAKRPSDP